MTAERQGEGVDKKVGDTAARRASIMPPHRVLHDVLDHDQSEALVQLAISRQAAFRPSAVGKAERRRLAPDIRTSLRLRPCEDLKPLFDSRLRELAPRLTAEMRLTPFEVSVVELELVAHGDGAFYKPHIDTQTGGDEAARRVLSCVYYFNHAPKAFTGGALRLFAIGDADRFIDIEPSHNSLLVFPSWAPHEVMPVTCPSGDFIDSRFAVNGWIRGGTTRAKAVAPSGDKPA